MARNNIPEFAVPTANDTEGDGSDIVRVTRLKVDLARSRRSILVRLASRALAQLAGEEETDTSFLLQRLGFSRAF